jgi:hypothetical protein
MVDIAVNPASDARSAPAFVGRLVTPGQAIVRDRPWATVNAK